ncbi:DUF6090 family protein [Jejudonia soesokkakensis]|uniref:DUF6090 family protein n=1 Tax=Jejudonia soesokkakensis TaxID=1323432 RepID=A0ABW2MW84_9FLAO
MIKFFRHIRQRLLTENKFSKYLLYAIGEIILVVIGILIALQINNLNEERKQNKLETEYLVSLQEEFRSNLQELKRVKAQNAKNLRHASELSKHTGPKTPTIFDEQFSKLFWGAFINEVQYRPGTGIINEIISSGNLSIIKNRKLKKALASLDGLMLKIRFQETTEHGNQRGKIFDLADETVGLRKMEFDAFANDEIENIKFIESNLTLLQSRKFDNLLGGFISTGSYLQDNYYNQLQQQLEEIIQIIESLVNNS